MKILDTMNVGTVGLNVGNIQAYQSAIKGLSAEQAVFALATKGANAAQIEEIMTTETATLAKGTYTQADVQAAMAKHGLATASAILTVEQQKEIANSGLLSAEKMAEMASVLGLTTAENGSLVSKKALNAEMVKQQLESIGIVGATQAQIMSILGLATAETGAVAGTNLLTASFAKLWAVISAHPIGAIITAVGALAVGVVSAVNASNKAKEEARQTAIELTNTYTQEKDSLDSQIEKYKELKETLDNGNLSTDEARSIKEQLLGIQESLIESYGNEASNIDLVNGKYKEQLGLLSELSKEKATDYVIENRDVFEDAKEALEKIRTYNLGTVTSWNTYAPETEDQKRLIEYLETYSDLLDLTYSGSSSHGVTATSVSLSVKADVENADEIMHQLAEDLEKYGKDNNIDVSSLLEGISGQLKKTWTDELTEYKTVYDEFMKAEIVRNDTLRPLYQESIKAVEDYNNALSTCEGVEETKANLDSVQQSVRNATGELKGSQDVFDGIYDGINKDAEAAYNLGQAFENDKTVQEYAEQLRGLSDIDLKAINFDNDNTEKGEEVFRGLMKTLGLTEEQAQSLIDKLVELGYVQGKVQDSTPSNETDILSFSEAWNDEDFSKAKDELLALAEAGRLTPETLQSTEEYKKFLEQTGMSAEETAKKINLMTDASTQLQSMSTQISKMSDMLADKKNGTVASADDLASFDVEVRGLESWKEFERVMGSSKSTMEQCQQAANDLVTEWVNNSNFLANLTEKTKQSYITQLEKMGVENAEQVVLTALGASTEYATLAIAHNSDEKNRNIQVSTDLSNATADEIIQLINEGNASDETANSLYHYALEKSNASNLTLATAADCSNLYNLVSALGVASSALKNYAYAKRVLESAQKWDDSPLKDAAIANAENTLKSLEASATRDIKTVFDKTNNVKISPKGSSGYKAPSTGKSKSGSGSSKSDTKQTVDWISRLLDVLQKKIDTTKAKFDNLFTLKSKKNNLNTQINQTKALLTATNKAADKYKKQADKVGLSKSLKKKVQSGDYNISNYSSETADKIQKYQDYYDKYKELKQQADELTTDIRNLRTERYQLYVDDAEAKIAKSQVYAELDAGNYKEQNKHLEYQKKQLKTQYDYLIKIAKLNKDSVEVAKLKAEYQKELNDLTMQEFDNIANTYDNKVGLNNNKIKAFQDQISLLEAKGQKIGSALYTKQMSLNNINEKKLIAEREKLIEKLNEIPKGTDDWYKAQDTLFSVESELVNVQIENANLQKSINQLKFDRFDDLLSKLNDIVDETDFLIDMLDSENFFDDNGKITDDGITAMGMYAQKRDIYKSEAEKYKQMQAELDQMYANGDIGIIDYETKMREYKSGQMDMAKAAEDMNKSIINLVSDGLEKQNQALSESIQKQKDLLKAEKDLKSFQDSLNDANKNISRLERQYEVLSGDDSEENRKRLREIKSQLEDAKKSRDDLLYDKSIEDQEKNLDDMYDAAVKSSEEYLKDSAKVLIDACGIVNVNTETVSKNIERISKETGVEINDNITKAWQNSGNAVSSFGDTITTKTPGIISQIKLIADEMDKLAEKSEKAAQAMVDAKTDNYLEHTTIGANGNNNGNGSSSETKKDNITTILENGSNKNPTSELAKAVQSAFGTGLTKGEMYQISSILKLGYKKEDFYDDSSIRNKAKNDVLQALIEKGYLKKSGKNYLRGFAKGGVISELSDAIRLNGDTVLFSANPGERILTEQQNGYWEKWTQSLPNLMNLTDIIKPNVNIPTAIPTVNREQSPVYNIDSSITVEGVATNEIVKDMANVAKKQAENVISEINRRTYAKGVRWK